MPELPVRRLLCVTGLPAPRSLQGSPPLCDPPSTPPPPTHGRKHRPNPCCLLLRVLTTTPTSHFSSHKPNNRLMIPQLLIHPDNSMQCQDISRSDWAPRTNFHCGCWRLVLRLSATTSPPPQTHTVGTMHCG